MGYAKAHPKALGMSDFTSSVVGRETARLQCVKPGWWHPENTCPANSPRTPGDPAASPLGPGDGDCTDPDCDIAEFYKQALFLMIGASPRDNPKNAYMWFSDYMPQTQAGAKGMLSAEFKQMIADPRYHQLTAPITGVYTNTKPFGASTGECLVCRILSCACRTLRRDRPDPGDGGVVVMCECRSIYIYIYICMYVCVYMYIVNIDSCISCCNPVVF